MADPRPHGEDTLGDAALGHRLSEPPAEIALPHTGRQYQLIHSSTRSTRVWERGQRAQEFPTPAATGVPVVKVVNLQREARR